LDCEEEKRIVLWEMHFSEVVRFSADHDLHDTQYKERMIGVKEVKEQREQS
jgi:hypothetical protein